MKKTITKRAVDALKPGQIIADDAAAGLRRSGACRPGGSPTATGSQRMAGGDGSAIGVGISPEAARKAAQPHAGAVAKDHDPVSETRERRQRAPADAHTFSTPSSTRTSEGPTHRERSDVPARPTCAAEDRHTAGQRPAPPGDRRVARRRSRQSRSPAHRRQDAGGLAHCVPLARTRDDDVSVAIVPGMARLTLKELSRDRILSDERNSVAMVGARRGAHLGPTRGLCAACCSVLLGSTKLHRLRWSEIDKNFAVVPAERVKTKIEHVLPVTSDLALHNGERDDGYIFSTDGGSSPILRFQQGEEVDWTPSLPRYVKKTALSRWSRGASTICAALRVPLCPGPVSPLTLPSAY